MKLSENGGKISGKAAPETINDRFGGQTTTNPFLGNGSFVPGAAQYTYGGAAGGITGPQPHIYLDNYAKQQ